MDGKLTPQQIEEARVYTRKVAETILEGNRLTDLVADNGYTVEDALMHDFPFWNDTLFNELTEAKARIAEFEAMVSDMEIKTK